MHHPAGCPRCTSALVTILGAIGRWFWVTCPRCPHIVWQLPTDILPGVTHPRQTVTLPALPE